MWILRVRTLCVAFALATASADAQTVQPVSGGAGIIWPAAGRGSVTLASLAIDATGEKVACIGRVPKTGTLDKFEWHFGAVTTPQAIRASFQDVDLATGSADATQDQFRDIATGSVAVGWAVPGLITSDGTDGGSKRSVTQGDRIAAVIEFESTAGNLTISTVSGTPTGADQYLDHFTASWAHQSSGGCNVALKYDDGTYGTLGPEFGGYSAGPANTSFNSSTSPDERGIKFRVGWKVQVGGIWWVGDMDAAVDVVLYDSDGSTPLATVSLDTDVRPANTTTPHYARFASNITLNVNTYYRAVVKPTTTTNVAIREFVVSAAAIMDVFEGGQDMHLTTRADAGAWTDTTTSRPLMGLLISGLSDNACSGSGGVPCIVR